MSLKDTFFKFFKLEDGVPLMTAAFVSISFQSLVTNVSLMPDLHIARAIIILSNIYVIINWIIALVGINKKNYHVAKLAVIFWSVYICFWFGLVALSTIIRGESYVCSFRRCPESMWLFNNSWHKNILLSRIAQQYDLDYDYIIKPVDKKIIDYNEYDQITEQPDTTEITDYPFRMFNAGEKSDDIGTSSSSLKPIKTKNDTTTGLITKDLKNSNGVRQNKKSADLDYESLDFVQRSNVQPVKKFSRNPFLLNVLMVFAFCLTFGLLAFGWLVLLNHTLALTVQVKSPNDVPKESHKVLISEILPVNPLKDLPRNRQNTLDNV